MHTGMCMSYFEKAEGYSSKTRSMSACEGKLRNHSICIQNFEKPQTLLAQVPLEMRMNEKLKMR